jgi:hypothetical protein
MCIVKKRKGDESIRDHEEAKEDAQGIWIVMTMNHSSS